MKKSENLAKDFVEKDISNDTNNIVSSTKKYKRSIVISI